MVRKRTLNLSLLLIAGCLGKNVLASNVESYKPKTNIKKTDIKISEITKKDSAVLLKKINEAKNGETIVIEDGEYSNLGMITITKDGIKLKAKNPGKVIFSGLVQFNIEGNDGLLEGVVFTKGGPAQGSGAVLLKGNNNTLANTTFYRFNEHEYKPNEKGEYNATRWITVDGKNNKVIGNRFEGKYRRGTLFVVNNSSEKDNHILANNIFKEHKPNLQGEFNDAKLVRINSNGWEAIRVGDSKTSLLPSGTTLAYNLFADMDGETELVSIKACETLLKGNTVVDSASMISLRHGNGSVIEDTVVLGNDKPMTGGIRFYGEDHIIRNNYIENVTGIGDTRAGISFNTGVNDVEKNERLDNSVKGKELNKQWTPKNIILENNTVINSAQNILYSSKVHKVSLFDNSKVEVVYPAVNMTLKNNLSYAEGEGKKALKGAGEGKNPINTKYENNIFYGMVEDVTVSDGVKNQKIDLKKVNGIMEANMQGLGAKELTVLTENMIGPNYNIK